MGLELDEPYRVVGGHTLREGQIAEVVNGTFGHLNPVGLIVVRVGDHLVILGDSFQQQKALHVAGCTVKVIPNGTPMIITNNE
jgi:hypothetical protein